MATAPQTGEKRESRLPDRARQSPKTFRLPSAAARSKRPKTDACGSRRIASVSKSMLKGSRDAIWSWNTDGIVVWWNAAAEKLLGYTADEIVGQSLMKLVRPERHEAVHAVLAAVRKGAWYERHETLRVRKDGGLVDVELTVSPVSDAEGRIIGGSTVCRPITERKQFEASLSRRMSELTSLFQFTERLQSANSLVAVCSAALDAIRDALGCDRASVLLFDADGVMRFVAWRGLSDGLPESRRRPFAVEAGFGRPCADLRQRHRSRRRAASR